MRTITAKYDGECRSCGADITAGSQVVYEKRVGVFCPGCAPTDPEEIRTVRQDAADRKAARYEEWASKRIARAQAQLNSHPEVRHDWAFITQPGRIPFRERMNRADDRAYDSLRKARDMRGKAASLRAGVRVKGDAEARRQERRDATLSWLCVGQRVHTCHYGIGTVKRINKKTATIENCGSSGTYKTTVDLSFLSKIEED